MKAQTKQKILKRIASGVVMVACMLLLHTNYYAKEQNGLYQAENGNWYYYENGKINTNVNSVVQCGKDWYFFKEGQVQFINSVEWNENGWWYIHNGKVDFSYNGLGTNENGTWYIENGKVNFGVTTIAERGDGWYLFEGGKVNEITTVAQNENGWWYVKNGKVDFNAVTVANNENGWWYIKNGKVDFDYNGLGTNENGTWYIKNGKVDFDYSGTYTENGVIYFITNGKAVPKTDVTEGQKSEYIVDLGNGETETITGYYNSEFEKRVIELVNEYRVENGLNPLETQTVLDEKVAIRGYEVGYEFSHTRPNGTSYSTVLENCGYRGVGENIAAGQRTPEAVMNSWKNSPGHNANMLNPNYKYIGVSSFCKNGGYGINWVQLFAY